MDKATSDWQTIVDQLDQEIEDLTEALSLPIDDDVKLQISSALERLKITREAAFRNGRHIQGSTRH